jgi:hypothetical protein
MTQAQIGILVGGFSALMAMHLTLTAAVCFVIGALVMAGLGRMKP